MELEELKRKLYKPGAEFEERLKEPEIFEPGLEKEKIKLEQWQKAEKKKTFLTPKRKTYLFRLGIGLGVIFLFVIGLTTWRGLTSFDKNKVSLEISGPERIVSGDEAVYTIKYKNNTKIVLKEVKLIFYYPSESLPLETEDLIQAIDLDYIGAGQENKVELKARVIGLKDSQKTARAKLSYKPSIINSLFENEAEFSTEIFSVPLVLDFDLPDRLTSGQSFSFSLEYLNQAQVDFKDLWLKLEYPAGFNFESAEPQPIERNNVWAIGDLMAGAKRKLFLNGTIEGQEGERKSFQAKLGILKNDQFVSYAEIIEALQISVSPLFVSQTVNGVTNYIGKAGEVLNYKIKYRNTTDVSINEIIITAHLEGPAIDLPSLKLEKGSFDGINQLITWNAGNLPELGLLEPYKEGEIGFSVRIKEPLPIKSYNDKNFIITNNVKINSLKHPLSLANIKIKGESELVVKIASQLAIQAKGFFRDDLIKNRGPIPPKVGETTTYTIKWQISNTSNDFKKVKVIAYLPPHVQWLNKIEPAVSDLKYNSQTGQLVWSVGDLPSATGILLPVKQIAFQVSITPGLAHLDKLVELIGQSRAAGQDSFTGLELENSDEPIDTNLPDDLTISRKDGIVVE
jgi:hypothetical protein